MEEIVNTWNVQLEQDSTTFTNEAVKVSTREPKSFGVATTQGLWQQHMSTRPQE